MNIKTTSSIFAIGCGLTLSASALAADAPKIEFPQASPSCSIKQRVGLTDIQVEYSRPSVKGRQIFGGLVPYGKVWRTGANSATKLVFSTDVTLNGHSIPAGTYALMTIPGKDEWTIIINKGSEQWGAYKYDEKSDVVRFTVKPKDIVRSHETFAIEINDIRDDAAELDLVWDSTKVPVEIKVDYVDKLKAQIDSVMKSDAEKKPYFQAAQFYLNHGGDLKEAKQWIDSAVAERDVFYINYVKAQILEKLGDKQGALTAAKHSTELAEKANDSGYVKLNADLIKRLQ